MEVTISSTNQAIIDKYLVGRIYPQIYAFMTGSIPDYLKVGDTYRGVDVRLDEWRKVYGNLAEVLRRPALLNENTIFRDYAIHKYLERELRKHRLTREEISPDLYFSSEFFRDTTAADVDSAIEDIRDNYPRHNGKYDYYTTDHLPQEDIPERDEECLTLRKNQADAVKRFKKALKLGRDKLLMYAVMRFGKTFTSLCCAKAMSAKKVLILTAKVDVMREWRNTVLRTKNFEGYDHFITSRQMRRNQSIIHDLTKNGENVVAFLSLQDLAGKTVKAKHKQVIDTKWDLVIIDETHFGARAASYGEIVGSISNSKDNVKEPKADLKSDRDKYEDYDELQEATKELKTRASLHLSGTPYRILMSDEFEPQDIVSFVQYTDILQAKNDWDRKYCSGTNSRREIYENPYFGFPTMVRFAFNPSRSALKLIHSLQNAGYTSRLSMLLRPKDSKDENGTVQFEYAEQVLELLYAIDGYKPDENILPFLANKRIQEGKLCRHIVMVLPFRASCDAMEQLIAQHSELENLSQYAILNIVGRDGKKNYPTPEDIVRAIDEYEAQGKKTITLTVNRMMTGSTVPQWDTMLYLKDTHSPQEYDQAIFRLQSPYVKEYEAETADGRKTVKVDLKPQTILVDFSPERMFALQEIKSFIYNVNTDTGGNDELKKRLKRELSYSPIITYDHTRLSEMSAPDVMKHIRHYQATRNIINEAEALPIDANVFEDSDFKAYISALNPIDAKNGLNIKPENNDNSGNNPTTGTAGSKQSKKSSAQTNKNDNKNDAKPLEKKLQAYYARLLFYAFLSESKIDSLTTLVASIGKNEDNRRIAGNLGIDPSIAETLAQLSNATTRRNLDYRIESVNKIWDEVEGTKLEKAIFALRKFGRFSESEIVTPANIADEMVALLPDYKKIPGGRILDIASKQGEFTIALLARYGQKIAHSIYSVCTSTVAYEFTRKIYKILGVPVDNIFKDFNSYDIIKENNSQIMQILKDMHFGAIIGNPPYQIVNENTSDDPIYHLIMDAAYKLSDIAAFITPARYIFNVGKTPQKWNIERLNDPHFKIAHYSAQSSVFFPNVDLKGGVAISLRDSKQNYGPIIAYSAFPELSSTLSKVAAHQEKSICSIIYPQNKFNLEILEAVFPGILSSIGSDGREKRLTTSIFALTQVFSKEKRSDDDIHILGLEDNKRTWRWISNKLLENHPNLTKWKVILPKSNGSGAIGEVLSTPIVGEPIVGEPCVGVTQSFITFGAFNSESEAEAALKYIKTKFCRALLGILKVTQDNSKETWKYVPLQDFTEHSDIDWKKSVEEIDKDLFKKYNLSPDEIDFIQSKIKQM